MDSICKIISELCRILQSSLDYNSKKRGFGTVGDIKII